MTKRQFTVLVFRLFAVFLSLQLLSTIGEFIRTFGSLIGMSWFFISGLLLNVVLPGWVIWLLWSRAEWLMQRIFSSPSLESDSLSTFSQVDSRETDNQKTNANLGSWREVAPKENQLHNEPLNIQGVEVTALTVLGAYLFMSAIPSAVLEILEEIRFLLRGPQTLLAPTPSNPFTRLLST